jgi:signal transduction histidine kinase
VTSPPIQVLLVEDNPGDARLLREMLKETSSIQTEVAHYETINEALSHLTTYGAGVVLLDIGLPDTVGLGGVRKVHKVAPRIPLIVLTGNDDEALATNALQEGAQDYLIKGKTEPQALLRAIRYAIERQRMQVEVDQVRRLQLQLRDEFISMVSHELRTPLTSIRGALGLLEGGAVGQLPEQAGTMVGIALQNSERLVRIINDILDVEKIKSGGLEMRIQSVSLAPFLEQALAVNRFYGVKYQVKFVLGAVTPDLEIAADPDRLMQVMANLLSNAAKFSLSGGEVRVRAHAQDARIRIEVEDHGSGIPEGFRSRVFEKFAQADASSSRRFEGTGLGLSITRQLIEAMGGKVGFDTVTGQGTTFFFELPQAGETLQLEQLVASSDSARCRILIFGDEADDEAGRAGIPQILHVEDDKDLSQVLKVALAGNAEVVLAGTLELAETLLRGARYSLLLLDMGLPDGDGLTLFERLASITTHPMPVVILSVSEVSREVEQRVAAALVKSRVSEAHIVQTILALVARKRA